MTSKKVVKLSGVDTNGNVVNDDTDKIVDMILDGCSEVNFSSSSAKYLGDEMTETGERIPNPRYNANFLYRFGNYCKDDEWNLNNSIEKLNDAQAKALQEEEMNGKESIVAKQHRKSEAYWAERIKTDEFFLAIHSLLFQLTTDKTWSGSKWFAEYKAWLKGYSPNEPQRVSGKQDILNRKK